MYDTTTVRDGNGTTALFRKEYTVEDPVELAAFDIAEETGNAEAVLTGLTIRNLEDYPTGDDPKPLLRVQLAEGDAVGSTVDVYPGRDSVYLRFPPTEQRTKVYLQAIGADVTANLVAEFEVSP